MKEPFVSSITYVKNGENYIEQCIRSIMNQTLKNIEIIVVDGGSTDGTLPILKALQEKDDRIILLNKAGSVGAQFNAALHVAAGEYIAVCEGDDYILPEKYEKQYNIAKKYQLDVLRANYYIVFDSKGKHFQYKVGTAPSKEQYDCLIDCENDELLFLSLHVNGFWNGLYSKEFLIKHKIYKNETRGAAYQDITFSFLTQLYAKRIWFMDECLHCYRIDNPMASVNSANCIEMLMTEYGLLKKELEKRELWEIYQSMFLLWEIYSYRAFSDKLPENGKENVLRKIYRNLRDQKVQACFKDDRVGLKAKNDIKALYIDEDHFIGSMRDCDEKNEEMLTYFKNIMTKDEKIILFGIGHFGEIILDYLRLYHKEVILVDNSHNAQRNGFRGQPVYDPEICCTVSDGTILIASVQFANEMYEQLLKLQIDKSRIIICENEDLFLRKIFVK